MPTHRKYKTGGRVAAADHPVESVDVSIPLDEPVAALLEPDPDDDAVANSVRSTIRAEGLQRHAQQQPQQTVAEAIDTMPGLTDHKRSFLRANPQFVTDAAQRQLLGKHYAAALAAGVRDDTDEINKFILDGIARDTAEHRHDHLAELLRSEPPPRIHESDDLDRVDRDLPAQPPPSALAPSPAPRRSMPMTAPVSREVPSGSRTPDMRSITLTPEQRVIARTSMHWLPHEEAERQYALNLRRMLQGKADGSIQ